MKLTHIFTHDISPGKLFNIPHQPHNVFLDLTSECNNHCVFCYNPIATENMDFKATPEKIIKIVELIGKTGTKEIMYLGGEPFAFTHILEVLSVGKKYGLLQRAVTNGSYFTSLNVTKNLKDAGLDEVGISFHSSNEIIHDRLAGRVGAYKDAIKGLDFCIKSGLSTFIQYSPNQLNNPNDILIFAKFLNKKYRGEISLFDINRLLPLGQAINSENVILDDKQWFDFLFTATELFGLKFDIHVELTPYCWLKQMGIKWKVSDQILDLMFKMNRGCFMWITQLPLNCDGNIKFCPAGEKVGPSILEIEWPDFWVKGQLFESFRSFFWNWQCLDFKNKKTCEYFLKCLGGCKYSTGGSYQVDKLAFNSGTVSLHY